MILALILAAATAATDAPAPQTATQAAALPAAAAPAPAKKEEMVCRKETAIGSRFPKTVCRPKAGYDALGAEERKAVEAAQHGWSQCGAASNTRC